MKKHNQWLQPRHATVRKLLGPILAPILRRTLNINVEPFVRQRGRQYLILFNHQTALDPLFVSMAFKGPIYFMAPDDLFSNGFRSSLMRHFFAPIPIAQHTADPNAVRSCIKVAKEGGTIAIAPEGSATYVGKTLQMNPAIVPLVRKLKLPIVLFRIEGGYGTFPRWSDTIRRGQMRAYVAEVIEPEEYAQMSDGELMAHIRKYLWVNAAKTPGTFKSDHAAEYLERVLYVCPHCGLSRLESHGNVLTCTNCNLSVQYLPNKQLKGVGMHFPFRYVADWYAYQCQYISHLNLDALDSLPIYMEQAQLSEVIPNKKKVRMDRFATVELYRDRVVINDVPFAFGDITAATVVGKNKLNLYYNDQIFQLKGGKRFNAVKFVNFIYRYKNIRNGIEGEQFLGL